MRRLAAPLVAAGMFFGCGGSSSSGGGTTAGSPPPEAVQAQATPIYLVVLENTSYASVIGNPVMPFFNSLPARGALATAYFGNTHPSLPNYFMLTTGRLIAGDDSFSGTVDSDNVVRQLAAAGKTWHAYLESLPSRGYLGDDVYPYIKHHNPFAYLTDVVNNPAQAGNLRPFSEFAADSAADRVADFNFIVPNNLHNAHDCPDGTSNCSLSVKLAAADGWLGSHIGPLLGSSSFNQHGLLIILFDEGAVHDTQNGGGHVACLLIGPAVRQGLQSATLFQHQSTLRLVLELLGAGGLPGAAGGAAPMNGFFSVG
ncbi:MAG TPA: alkaline phosphatase family protein [Terriglobales bacterium]|nr:alkaline phosphatase family protein [Terriglobales bacterium]